MSDDPHIPGGSRWSEALIAAISGAVSIGLMGGLAHLASAPFIFPSLGPTAFLLFYRPLASSSSPRNTVWGHAIGAGCGLFALWVTGLLYAPSALEQGVTLGRALAAAIAMGGTSGLMVLLRVAHPPAGATTLIVALGLMTRLDHMVVLMSAVCLLVLQAVVTHRLSGTAYPWWAAPGEDPPA